MRRFDAVVVGGGAVGAATAAALARAGVTTALLERGEAPASFDAGHYDLRVYALASGSRQFLEKLGAWSHISSARVSPYETMHVWEDAPAQALHFEASAARVPQLGHIVENKLLLSALWQQLDGVSRFENSTIATWSADPGGVHLQLSSGDELEARVLVAADGADSALRQQAGIDCATWPYPQQAVVCHVDTAQPHQRSAWQRFLPTGPLAFLPLADGRSSIVWSSTEAWMLQTLDDPAFLAALEAASQGVLGTLRSCSARITFPLRLLHAREYVRERLVLVGDAAHVIHPLAGQGVNLGLADAAVLAEVLGQAKKQGRDLGGRRVLQRYERQRRADALEMLALTEGLYRMFAASDAPLTALRRTGLEAVQRLRPLKDLLMQRAMQR